MTDGLETSEASMGVGSAETDTTGLLKGLGEVGLSAEGVDGGIEFAKLIFALSEACDIGRESPIPQVVRCFSKMGVTGRTPLKEAEEPRTHGFRRE